MTDQRDEEKDRARRQRERRYEIDRITFQYAEQYRQGKRPRIEDYIQRYPQYASDLLDYALYFHTIGFEAEPFEEPAELKLSPAGEKALARIRARRAASAAAPAATPVQSLFQQGMAVNMLPPQLAAAVGLTAPLLARLEARKIAVASIPRTLIQRLASVLQTVPEAIIAYLSAGQAGAFYYADQPPAEAQETFLAAVQGSGLSPEQKSEWTEIVKAEIGDTP